MEGQATNKKKTGFQMPHVFIILLVIMLLIVVMAWFIPSGVYERVTDEATGRSVVNPENFTYIKNEHPITFLDYFRAVYTGFVNGASIMGTLLISAGVLYALEISGAFGAGIHKILQIFKGREFTVVIIFYTIFVIFGVIGFGEAAYPFYPLAVVIALALGYDRVVGAGICIVGSSVGFTSGLMNMFTTGVAQQLVGLPLFSGIGYRCIGFVVFYIIGFAGLYRYCKSIRNNPRNSLVKEEFLAGKSGEDTLEYVPFTKRRIAGLLCFLAVIAAQAAGCLKLGWGFADIAAVYVLLGVVLAVIFRISPSDMCTLFVTGASRVLAAAFAIGLANSVVVLMEQAQILDTLVYTMAQFLNGKNAVVTLLIIFVFVTLFNFFVVSGSGKAVIMMPILQPLGKILNINQQVLVLAYQYGDGITNSFWPGSSMVALAMCGLGYDVWLKFCWKIYAAMMVSGYILVVISHFIGYGPF